MAKPAEHLYDAVALAMRAFAHARFRVETLGETSFRVERGSLLVSTHRADTDVPVLCGTLYGREAGPGDRTQRVWFAARDDLFEDGFFSGFHPAVPRPVRRAVFGLGIGGILPRVRVLPIAGATSMRLGQALRRVDPATRLADAVGDEEAGVLRDRAAAVGEPTPRTVGDVLSGTYADLLWRIRRADDLAAPALEPAWRVRRAEAMRDFRALVELLKTGEPLVLFPEGRPSPDGALGPLRPGLGALVRRAGIDVIRAFAVAYDELTAGRPRAFVSVGERFETHDEDVEGRVLAALARATPLTCAAVVAPALAKLVGTSERATTVDTLGHELRDAVEEADAAGRAVEPALRTREERRERLEECLTELARREAVRRPTARTVVAVERRLAGERAVARAVREQESIAGLLGDPGRAHATAPTG